MSRSISWSSGSIRDFRSRENKDRRLHDEQGKGLEPFERQKAALQRGVSGRARASRISKKSHGIEGGGLDHRIDEDRKKTGVSACQSHVRESFRTRRPETMEVLKGRVYALVERIL